MADFLAAIVERKRREVDSRLRGQTIDARPTTRSLRTALAKPGARFIMEVKRASPSGHRSARSVREAVAAYAPVADAISVLTDGPAFAGSLDDLAATRAQFRGPILAKDFIVDPGQVSDLAYRLAGSSDLYEASGRSPYSSVNFVTAHDGFTLADLVSAMLSVLSNEEAQAVMAEAARLAMDVVFEVHDEKELERSLLLQPKIIGVNNRDLKTLTTDLSVTERLAPLIPAGVLAIAESGIASRADVDRLAPLVDGFLVGSALMAAPDTGQAARALIHGRVKLCGLTNCTDIAFAGAAGASYAGLILVAGTARAVGGDRACDLAAKARAVGQRTVGVFRDSPVMEIVQSVSDAGLDIAQLHGSETDEYIDALRGQLPTGTEIWAACQVNGMAAPARRGADRSLFDTARDGASGGTGRSFDWRLVAGRDDLPDAFIAGGIGPDNAREAAAVGAYGLDIGSRVECAPGIKDPDMGADLFAALRPAARSAAC